MSETIVSSSYVSSQQHYYYACFAKKEIKAQNSSGTCPGHTASEQQNRGSKAGGVVPKPLLYMLLCVSSSPPSTELWVAGTEQRHGLCLQCNASAQIQAGLSRLQLENAINSLCWIARAQGNQILRIWRSVWGWREPQFRKRFTDFGEPASHFKSLYALECVPESKMSYQVWLSSKSDWLEHRLTVPSKNPQWVCLTF